MTKKTVLKKPLRLLAMLLAVFFIMGCAIPLESLFPVESTPTVFPTFTKVPTQMPTLLPTVSLDCENIPVSKTLGIVKASPNGGLNIRNLPIEMGGDILFTVQDGVELEIFDNFGDDWVHVRLLMTDGTHICGVANKKYIEIQ